MRDLQIVNQTSARDALFQKNSTILFMKGTPPFRARRFPMRFGPAIVAASMAALLTLAAPGLARNSDTPKPSEQPTAASCHSYQQAADKSWIELPCQELGAPAEAEHKSATRTTDQPTR
jgi:hypothetical protein